MNPIDAALLREIEAIIAIDDHGHPQLPGAEEVDQDRPINPYDYPLGLRMRPTNPEHVDAWQALWGYQHDDNDPDHLRELIASKQAAQQRPDYHRWLFEQLRTESMIYIGITPESDLPAPWFRWAPHVDWMLWPFSTVEDPDPILVPNFKLANQRQCRSLGIDGLPATLDDYLADVVAGSLAQFAGSGAVAIKFNCAYYRPLSFDNISGDEAAPLYARAREGANLTESEHRAVQDHIFRRLVTEAGTLDLPVQIHTGLGAKPRFIIANSNPLLLESVFRDVPRTQFLLLHGGWPFDREATAALAHENVYLDFSVASLYFYPRRLAELIRGVLEWFPEKLIYGSDSHSDRSIAKLSGVPPRANPLAGWEEKSWLVDRTSRQALTIALSGMLDDGQIGHDQALPLAQQVMRANALSLYPRLTGRSSKEID